MSHPPYQRVKQALLRARALDPPARAEYLEHLGSTDPHLRAEVESLLAADAAPAPIVGIRALAEGLGAALAPALQPGPEHDRSALPPATIGPYTVVGLLGEGGMGVVYHAEQTAPLRREVALKVIRRGLDTERVVARFDSERQALALMDHPNIARVFDAGADAAGRPYFAMELVRGQPITVYAHAAGLGVRERVELFLQVCDGVQHAHQKGVMHRDLKPGNILVAERDSRPIPKVIDFGIAKAIAEPLTGHSLLTQEGQMLGTPDYMSPEQAGALGTPVDVRSDVYSLGVVLYELLTGTRPYRLDATDRQQLPHRIATTQPERPSTRVAALLGLAAAPPGAPAAPPGAAAATPPAGATHKLRRQLSGDLDNIVLMALRKEPHRRYGSVEALAADLRRHLAGLPVLARQDTWSYRAGKFVRRNRGAVGAAVAAIVLLAGWAVTMTVQSARVARQRNRAVAAERAAGEAAAQARTEAAASRQVSDFLVKLFEVSNPDASLGDTITVREVLDRGAARIATQLADQPAVQGRLMYTMGEVYHGLALHARAQALLDSALAIRATVHGDSSVEVAQTLQQLGTVRHDRGDYQGAVRDYRRALAIWRGHQELHGEELATSLNLLAISLQALGELDQAEPLYREALALHRSLRGDGDAEVAWDMNTLGQVLFARGEYPGAEELFRQALDIQRQLFGDVHPDRAATLNNLAGVLLTRGDAGAAERVFREALGIYQTLYGQDHAAVARAMKNLGTSLRELGRDREAEELFQQALAIYRRVLGGEHPYIAASMTSLAQVLAEQGELAGAERLQRDALAMQRRLLGAGHRDVGLSLVGLADVLRRRGRMPEAARAAEQALAVLEQALPQGHWQVANARFALGRCLAARGRTARADSLLAAGYQGMQAALGASHPRTQVAAVQWAALRQAPHDASR